MMQHLQPNTTLQGGKYRIERVLGQGGFGNTYVGVNTVFNERVAIKEFFMRGVTLREDDQVTVSISVPENRESFKEQKEKFKKEALRIRQLKNEHIVSVHDLFEENGTAYYVMDYVDGENLAERLKKTGRPMTESEVRLILPQILDALKAVHEEKMWHLDLKPANIMLEKGGKVKLIDFGASKQLNAQKGGATTSTAISYTNGYAPREQMEQNYDKFGPWTDIYALGATLYNLLTNKRPPLPTDIDDDMSEDKHLALPFPENVGGLKFLVLQMMKTNRLQRPQSVDAIISAEKTRKEEPKQTPRSAKASPKSSSYDDEATIVAEPKPKKERKTEAPKPRPKVQTSPKQETNTYSHIEDNGGGGLSKNIIIVVGVLLLFVGIFLLNYDSFSSYINSNQNEEPQETQTSQVEASGPQRVTGMQYQTAIGGCRYSGPVDTDNRPNGHGEAFFDDGRYYNGDFENGELTGDNCVFKYPEGDTFEGKFRSNRFYYGKYTISKDNSYYYGLFDENGQPSKGTWYDKKGNILENI